MQKILAKAILVLMLSISTTYAATSAESQLLTLEQTWMKAAQKRDLPTLKRILSDKYIDISYKGIIRTRADALSAPNIKMKRYTQRLDNEKVRIFGDAAVITGLGTLETVDHHRIAQWRFTDIFVKQGGIWRAVSSQETVLPGSTG